MVTGFNTDITHHKIHYHVQTEDRGRKSAVIETRVYRRGEILVSRRVSYADIMAADILEEVVSDLMKDLHEQVIKELTTDQLFPLEEEAAAESRLSARDRLLKLIEEYQVFSAAGNGE